MDDYDRDEPVRIVSIIAQFTAILVRLVGVLLLLVGLVISIEVVVEAWDLYRVPEQIERFAWAIEKGSNLDQALAPFTASRPAANQELETGESPDQQAPSSALDKGAARDTFRLSYFLAWVIALLLLMLIGRLALSAVKTGGELALYNVEVKKFARTLIKEVTRSRSENEQGLRHHSVAQTRIMPEENYVSEQVLNR